MLKLLGFHHLVPAIEVCKGSGPHDRAVIKIIGWLLHKLVHDVEACGERDATHTEDHLVLLIRLFENILVFCIHNAGLSSQGLHLQTVAL